VFDMEYEVLIGLKVFHPAKPEELGAGAQKNRH
jgi:hypothetical protein